MKWRPLHCLPLKLTLILSLFCVYVGEIYKCQVLFFCCCFFPVCVFVFLPLEVLSVIVFMSTMWTPREALSVATCFVNKCDYIYFVHSYDRRIIFSLIQAELMMSLLPLKKKKPNKKKHWRFCRQTTNQQTWIC